MDVDLVVIGAGVVGLAVAQRMARGGRSVLVLEQESSFGQHCSSRNSEVIHAGIYYAPGSLKAQLCRQGRDLLYDWCRTHAVPHRALGKLLVAVTKDEIPALKQLQANAAANGVELHWQSAEDVAAREPQVRAVAGLFSPLTGIVDSHALMQSFEAALQSRGGELCCNTRVDALEAIPGGLRVTGTSAGESFAVSARQVVNAGGLFAQQLQKAVGAAAIPALSLCQGRYFNYSGRSPFSHLVYPMPEANAAGLGVHATLDLGGQLRFGPDVRYLDQLDYQVDDGLRDAFATAIRRYWPDCDAARLQPAYAGVRPKLSGPGEPPRDFVIQDQSVHGIDGLVSLFGIESPGLTASLALAEQVAARLDAV
ncbi:NAD(P)/FAD-dependent oxidoreductase [Halopseudomonas sp.]|uniref:NAD(P)/FAD-dependent oxidoreductase n=1 Tax=Halopseudomonas sp. TaxID=2901191 RepID=UPI00311F670A